ncbi:MAG: ATP-binding protein [Bacteroidetes bacterium]|nr:MAG: ATP-binding protein [Bacteroidota bacterium]
MQVIRKYLPILLSLPLLLAGCREEESPPAKNPGNPNLSTDTAVLPALPRTIPGSDSLALAIASLPDDTSKIDALDSLAMSLRNKDSAACATYALYMLWLSEKLQFPEGRARAYYILGRLTGDHNAHEKAIGYLEKGASVSEQAGYGPGLLECYYWIARYYRRLADYPGYHEYLSLLEQEVLSQHNKLYLSYAWEGYGNLYRYLGDYPQSIHHYMRAVRLSEELGELEDESTALNNMSLVYEYQGNNEEALKVQLLNYDILRKLGDRSNLALCLSNLSNLYDELGSKEKARQFIDDAIAVVNEAGPGKIHFKDLGSVYCQYADLHAEEGRYDSALVYYRKDLDLRMTNGDKKAVSECYSSFAYVYELMGEDQRAEEYLLKSLTIAKEIGFKNGQKNAYESLADLETKQGNYREAYQYMQQFKILTKTLDSAASIKQAAETEAWFKVKEQQQQIMLMAKDREVQALELNRTEVISYALGGGLFLILMLSLAVFKGYKEKKRANQDLERKVDERTKALTQRNKDLKNFIYKSSHDLRSPIATIKGLLHIAQRDTSDNKNTQVCLDKIATVVEKQDLTLQTLLKISRVIEGRIEPEKIKIKTLLREVCSNVSIADYAQGAELEVHAHEDLEIRSDRVLIASVIENLVSNGIKYSRQHGQTARVRLEASRLSNGVSIRVSDNGEGIAEEWKERIFELFTRASAYASGSGLGLYIVRNSVEMLGGTVSVESSPGKGSTFTVWLPLDLPGKNV